MLIVATAALLGWLFVAVTRSMLGDFRWPALHPSPLRSTVAQVTADAPAVVSTPEPTAAEEPLADDTGAERAVRERLYGQPKRSI